MGKAVQASAFAAAKVYSTPRILAHAGVIALVGAIVLGGSTGHNAGLNPLADQTSQGTVLDQASAAVVAAKVANQSGFLVTQAVDSSAETLNAQVSLPTSDDGTLAPGENVDTSGANARGITTYEVQPGDTVASVAAEFDITSDTVAWANDLSGGNLTVGQKLTILPISGVQYTVQAGDTAQSIAAHFKANADQIMAFNSDQSQGLQAGQSIIVPDGVMPAAPAPAPVAAAPAGTNSGLSSFRVQSVAGGPNGYSFGYCTWYVATRRAVPSNWGNAISWYAAARASGYSVGSVPAPGAIAWTGAGYYGHVAYVESVSGGMVTVSEMNWNGNWDRKTFRTVPASTFRYIY